MVIKRNCTVEDECCRHHDCAPTPGQTDARAIFKFAAPGVKTQQNKEQPRDGESSRLPRRHLVGQIQVRAAEGEAFVNRQRHL